MQESRAVAKKSHYALVKFNTYRYLQRHRAVLPVWLKCRFTQWKAVKLIKAICNLL